MRVKAFNTLPKYSAPPSTAVTFSPSGPVAPIVLTDSSYGFAAEQGAVATDGTNVWVPLTSANSITEFNGATGALIRVLNDDTNLASPAAAVSDGHGNMWVLNQGVQDNSGGCSTCTASSVTEINGSTGAFEANYPIAACGYDPATVNCLGATSLAYVNGSLWVVISGGYFGPGAIRQVNATRGTIGQTVVPSAGFGQNLQIAAAGSDFWVATGAGCNGNGGSVTQFDGTTGAELQVVGDCTYGMVNPGNIYSDGTSLYVVGENVDLSNPDSFTKINASTGALDYTSMTGIGYVMNNSFQSMAIDGSGNLWSVQLYGGIQLNKTSDGTINRTFGSGDVYGGGMVYAGGRIWQAGASTNTLTGWAA